MYSGTLPGYIELCLFHYFYYRWTKKYVFEVIRSRSKHLYSLMWAFEREHRVWSWPPPHLLITALIYKYSGISRKVDFKENILQLELKLPLRPAYVGLKFLKLHISNGSVLLFSSIWSCIWWIFILLIYVEGYSGSVQHVTLNHVFTINIKI